MSVRTFCRTSATLFGLFSALACIGELQTATAATISGATQFGTNAGTGPGVGLVTVPLVTSFAPNNDDEAGPVANNVAIAVKRFDALGYIDIECRIANSGGTSEYMIFEAVDNNTGVPWLSHSMQLGFGVGAGFIPSAAGDGLDFDAPNFTSAPTSTVFPNVARGEDLLVFSGAVHGAGLQTYSVRVDVPDGNRETFTLRQSPSAIPEPATLALAGVAALGLIAARRRA